MPQPVPVRTAHLSTFLFGLLLSVALSGATAEAQAPANSDTSSRSLQDVLRANRYSIGTENDTLQGTGGEWLLQHAKAATVVTLGESHGTREIPTIMEALFEELQAAGEVDHLALEVSPWSARLMTNRLRAEPGSFTDLLRDHPASIPFYFLKPERDLVRSFVRGSEVTRSLWGLDQIFAFATQIALDRLKELAPTTTARSAVETVRIAGQGDSLDAEALPKLPPSMPTPLMAYPSVAFDTLRGHFQDVPEAQRLLDEITTSIPIYRTNDTSNYRSNQMRARYLRQNLLRAFHRAQRGHDDAPKVAVKVGARHAYRDRTPNNALDVGNLAVALAQEVDGTALNVAVVCGPDSEYRDFPAGTSDCWSDTRSVFKPVLGDEPALFDLTALHPLLHDGTLDPGGKVERLLWGFDAIVLIPNATPSSYVAPPTGR